MTHPGDHDDAWLEALLRGGPTAADSVSPDEQVFVQLTMQRLRQQAASQPGLAPQAALALAAGRLHQQAAQIRALWLGALVGVLLALLLFGMLGGMAAAFPSLTSPGRSVQLLPWLSLLPTALLAWLSLSQREW